ncbi:patatin-like protein 2 [Dorcoceras hygrometricum]|uniref:Patatin-like protein 2 n=1 Tax=Dorcoceras hygrometricum TaxID=472368 RepID=A0A2Z7AP03_9LAMI|nr:patatin-like protein 2 [Dorcoceras hygrometricum]
MTFRFVRTNQYNQDLGLIHSTNGNHLESPNEGSSIDHQVTIYLHAQNITMFPTNETWRYPDPTPLFPNTKFIYQSEMASSLFINTVHVCFESVLSMENAGMVAMFESLVDTGLKDLSEIPKDLIFDARSIVSLSGEPVSMLGKKKEMAIEFRLLCDILAKTISVKAGSFDAITQEKFLMMATITCGIRINWNRLLFNIFKDMVTPGSRQAKGYAIQISLLLENVPNLELGKSSEFPSSKVLTEKTVHRYIVVNDKVGMEVVTAEPRVKKTPVKKATSKKRPATDADAERVMKKKRTTKSISVSAKETLETLLVEVVPLQMIAPIPVVPTEQPPVPKRKTQKRNRRLILSPDDEIVGSEPVVGCSIVGEAAVEAVDDMAEKDVETVVEIVGISEAETAVDSVNVETSVDESVSLPAVEVVLNEGISTADEVDIIIEQVIAETAQIDTDVGDQDVVTSEVEDKTAGTADEFELWFNLSSEEIQARLDVDRPIETASDTYEEFIADQVFGTGVEKMEIEAVEQSTDEAMSLEDILMTIPVDCPLPSAGVEVTKIILGGTISTPGVNEGDWYKASIPKISAAVKGKAPLLERDPAKGNPIKEQLSLILADIELMKKQWGDVCLEVAQFSVSGKLLPVGSLNFCRTLAVFEPVSDSVLANLQLLFGDGVNYVQLLFVFRDVQIAQSSVFAISSVQSSFASADLSYVQLLLDQRPQSPSTIADSSMHFVEDDIQLEVDSALDHFISTSSATAVSTSIDALRESFSNVVATQSKDSRQTNNALGEVMNKIDHVKRVFLDSIAEHDETFRCLFKRSRQEAQNDNNALSLALKAVRNQNVILYTDLEATRKEVRDIKAALSKDFDDKLADIRNELLEFRVERQGQLSSLRLTLQNSLPFSLRAVMKKRGKVVAAAPSHLLTIKIDPAGEMVEVAIEQKSRADTEVEVVVEAIGVDLPREDIPAVVVDSSGDLLKIG